MTGRVALRTGLFSLAQSLEFRLGQSFAVSLCTTDEDVLALCDEERCDVVLVDAGPTGALDLCGLVKRRANTVSVLALTPPGEPARALEAVAAGADECLELGGGEGALPWRLRSLAERTRLAGDAVRRAHLSPGSAAAQAVSPRILILDPNPRSRTRLAEILSELGPVTALAEAAAGLIRAAEGAFDLAIVGAAWPDWEAQRLCRQLLLVDPASSLRLLLVSDDVPDARFVSGCGADDVLLRPVSRVEALARVRLMADKQALTALLRRPVLEPPVPVIHPLSQRTGRLPPERWAA
ncbi:MAG TPA: hypothetical protein VIL09_06070 [Microvirga sp.]|jgi:two-component system cell cycle response regulator